MNLYVRFYDGEAIVSSVDELIERLKDFGVPASLFDDEFMDEIYDFVNSKIMHLRRFRVTPRQYFILIKTVVSTLEEFKANAKSPDNDLMPHKVDKVSLLSEVEPGWYEGTITFKRVVFSPRLNKFQYKDTTFKARVKAQSGIDCYNRIVEHLQNRQEIDPRSQFPSAKGRNFNYAYLGDSLTK